jgi:hypothetical protein
VAVVLLAVLVGFAIVSRDDSSSESDLPERVGDWYQARAAPMDSELEGTTTACGVRVGPKTLGVTDPVLPCGSKIYVGFRDQDVLTQVIGTGLAPGGVRFALTPYLGETLGIDRTATVRWSYARESAASG